MDQHVLPLEPDQRLFECRADCEREGQFKFQMIQRGDFIKPGWWHWRCRREDGAGQVAYGYVQADTLGLAVAPETFEGDRL